MNRGTGELRKWVHFPSSPVPQFPSCTVHVTVLFAMRSLKLTITYDGTNYVGWQR